MAFQSSPVLDFSFKAAEDLRNYQYHFVKIDANNTVRLLDSNSELPDGVLQNAPNAGEEATVRILGISKVVANAGLTVGTFVKAEFASGTDCGKAQANTNAVGLTMGRVVCAAGAEDDLCSVLLTPYVGLS
ncbi:MAG: DUF2190 family protein [Candidatus Gastranaerophilales bacterium]|nr:DUF2190 family protein [Candidatus Gastranaerophilales bacterium]